MRNPWIVKWTITYGGKESEMIDMPDYLPVTIYADTTKQYTEEEIEELQDSNWGQMIEIPVPRGLLKQWWYECGNSEDGWDECTEHDFWKWFNEESTADDTDTLYDWLVAHNYCWKRLDTEYSHAQHYGN